MSVRSLKGIGEKTEKLFNRINVYTINDLVHLYPRSYDVFKKPVYINEVYDNSVVAICGVIVLYPKMKTYGKKTIISTIIQDEKGDKLSITWFNMPYIKSRIHCGDKYVFRGRIRRKNALISMEQPVLYSRGEYEKKMQVIQPLYPKTKGLSNTIIANGIKEILFSERVFEGQATDEIAEKYDLKKYMWALKKIHYPSSKEELIQARERLVFDEFYKFLLDIHNLRKNRVRLTNNFKIEKNQRVEDVINNLPYDLTNAQKKVLDEIRKDLFGETVASRLIQGDVGSGKTILAFLALIETVLCNYQGAMMAPTEVLAHQHFLSLNDLIIRNKLNIKTALLTGSLKASEKKEIYDKISTNEINVVIGTHALIQEKVEFKNLALVITDEQHRFGVRQRDALKNKGNDPHVLVMSATPIPRTLALILYGDLDISVVDEMPLNRLSIKNCLVGKNYRKKSIQFILDEIKNGHQAYIVCPMIQESDNSDLENVLDYVQSVQKQIPPGVITEALHGDMKPEEKNEIMDRFSKNQIHILISTTVIEVGINVPNATVMMIENAERFGLATLHQLRGRVGRGQAQSYCIFIAGTDNNDSLKKLEIINQSNDGFFIAEEDLKNRGPGDVFGIRQSGDLLFKSGDIYSDYKILEWAREAVATIKE